MFKEEEEKTGETVSVFTLNLNTNLKKQKWTSFKNYFSFSMLFIL